MASRETEAASPFASLWSSPLPLWAAALLCGQGLAAARIALDPGDQGALAAGAALAALARRPWITIALALALAGYLQTAALLRPPADPQHVAALAGRRLDLRARVLEIQPREEGRIRLLLEARAARTAEEWRAAHGLALLTLAEPRRAWSVGALIEAPLLLRRPRNFGNPGEFDYEGYLARRGVHATAFLRDDAALVLVKPAAPGWIDAWRARVSRLLAELDSPAREIVAALILGEMGSLPERVRQQFAATGVSHVLSISGLHVAMVGGAAYAVLRWLLARSEWLLLRTRVPLWAAASSLAPVWLYAELAQAGVATWRALVMLAVLAAAVLAGRRADLFASLAAAAIVVALLWPGVALDVSFQLSFVAVAALALGLERYWRWWRVWQEARLLHLRGRGWRWLGWGLASLVANLSALAATTPLTALHFNQVAPLAVVANPLVVPLLGTVSVGLGLLGAAMALAAEPPARLCLELAGAAAALGASLCAWLARWPGAGLRVVTPTPLELLLLYAGMAALAAPRGPARRRVLALVALALALDLGWAMRERWFRRELRLTFLAVGQGDCTVIEFPGSAVMVVDGGGLRGFDSGARIAAPYLWRQRVARLDYLVLTHPQFDHYGGLASLAREFAPREFWHSGARSESASFAALRRAVSEAGARDVVLGAGASRQIGGCRVEVLWPPSRRALSVNDASLVLRIDCGAGASVLLPGDLEAAGERALLATGVDLRAAVLKVPHHGSGTSTTHDFLAAVAPRIGVISAGFENRFGFPDAGVLTRLRQAGVEVRRTDESGAVVLRWPDAPQPLHGR